jgi:hypothetical protein
MRKDGRKGGIRPANCEDEGKLTNGLQQRSAIPVIKCVSRYRFPTEPFVLIGLLGGH